MAAENAINRNIISKLERKLERQLEAVEETRNHIAALESLTNRLPGLPKS